MSDEIAVIEPAPVDSVEDRLKAVEEKVDRILAIMEELRDLTTKIPELLGNGGIGALMGGGPMGAIMNAMTKRH